MRNNRRKEKSIVVSQNLIHLVSPLLFVWVDAHEGDHVECCIQHDRPSLQWSRPIVSQTVRMLDPRNACMFHFYVPADGIFVVYCMKTRTFQVSSSLFYASFIDKFLTWYFHRAEGSFLCRFAVRR